MANMTVTRARPLVVSIVGTRPEAIKMAPLVRALEASRVLTHHVLLTGQHSTLAGAFDIPPERITALPCDPRNRSAPRLREMLHRALCGPLRRSPIDLVLVQGDTASAVAGALAARGCGIPVGHVEAGLRSHDLRQPWPEEGNRVAIDAVSDLLFAPTERAAANLRSEWRVKGAIHVTGNTGIDALMAARARIGEVAAGGERKLILATCHRRENQGEPLLAVCDALKRLVNELPLRVALPLHPNRHARRALEEALAGTKHIELMEPLGHEETVRLMASSWLILSDSGGLQEEGPALGKPVLVLRDVTERPEAVESGNIALVGTRTDAIVDAVSALLADEERYCRMSRPAFPFGDGRASERIATLIEQWLRVRRSVRTPASAERPAVHAL
jgi:UDP-N-acetylglucosamine 2-epimerase (non-hydrolysing)